MADIPLDRQEPIPLEEITEGYYWAQFMGPLEVVQVINEPSWGGPNMVKQIGYGYYRHRYEFRFWQRIEPPIITLEDVSNVRKARA